MIQVENEVNVEGDSRDRSPAANKAFAGPVPKELMDYLQKQKDGLISEFRQVWETAGFKTAGTWEEVFGKVLATDEIFMAWNYSRYIGRVAADRYTPARHLQQRRLLCFDDGILRPIREPAVHPRVERGKGRRHPGALRLRTPQRHGLLAFRHRRVQSARPRPDRRLRPH